MESKRWADGMDRFSVPKNRSIGFLDHADIRLGKTLGLLTMQKELGPTNKDKVGRTTTLIGPRHPRFLPAQRELITEPRTIPKIAPNPDRRTHDTLHESRERLTDPKYQPCACRPAFPGGCIFHTLRACEICRRRPYNRIKFFISHSQSANCLGDRRLSRPHDSPFEVIC
jgi:hypothetical protein